MAASDALLARIDALFPDGEHQPPAVQLRRSIALWLAGSPRPEVGECAALLTTLGSYLRQSQAHLWLDPDQRWPKLKAFLEEPDSQGAFRVQEVQDVAVRLNLRLLLPPQPAASPSPASPSHTAAGESGSGGGNRSTATGAKGPAASAAAAAASKVARDLARMVFPAAGKTAGRDWRLITDPGHRLRRAVAMWLADNPAPGMGAHRAPLTWVGDFVRRPEHAEMWLEVASKYRNLQDFLQDAESQGAFRIESTAASPSGLVLLDLEAMQGVHGQPAALRAAAARAAPGTASGAASTAESGRGPVAKAPSLMPAPSMEAIAAAAAAAWPGDSPQCVLRRHAAAELAAARPFPGVHNSQNSMLLAKLGETLLRAKPKAAAQLKADMGGKVQWLAVLTSNGGAELLSDKEAAAALAAAGTAPTRDPYSHFLLRVVKGECDRVGVLNVRELLRRYGGNDSGAGGIDLTASARSSGGELQKHKMAKAPAGAPETTAKVEAALASAFPARGPGKVAAHESEELRLVALLLMQAGPPHRLLFAQLGEKVPRMLGRACPRLRYQCIDRPDVFEVAAEVQGSWAARLVCPQLLQLAPVSRLQSEPPKPEQPQRSSGAAGSREARHLQGLVRAAFLAAARPASGSGVSSTQRQAAAAIKLRQAVGVWLVHAGGGSSASNGAGCSTDGRGASAASPDRPYAGKLSDLSAFLSSKYEKLWCEPAFAWPKLSDFLLQPESGGAFEVVPPPRGTAGNISVALNVPQLQAIAAATSSRAAADAAAEGNYADSAAATSSGAGAGAGAAAGLLLGKPLTELIHMAFPLRLTGDRPVPDKHYRQLRQAIAGWLASSPYSARLGPHRAKLSHIGHFLVREQAALWRNPAHKFPKLKDLLGSDDSRGVFVFEHESPGDSDPVVLLCEQALQAAAAALLEARGQGGGGGSSSGAAAAGAVAGAGAGAPGYWEASGHEYELADAAMELGNGSLESPRNLPALVAAAPPTSLEVATAAAGKPANGGDCTQPLPEAGVYVVADPYGEELIAMLQHCGCCTRIGLAVQAHGGRPALVSVYAPPALMKVEGPEEHLFQWPAAVYLVDPLAAAASYGGGADGDFAAAALLCSLQPLLEAPSVAKVVHGSVGAGGSALACLEAVINLSNGREAAAALAHPVLDTSLILASVESMLGVPHTPPLQAAQTAGPDSSVAWLRGLHAHVARLRDALAGTGLWADRPQLLATLTARHFAALREDAQAALGAAGGDEDAAARVLTRPLGPSQLEVAARAARHLPELWAALVQEVVPWVAAYASAAAMVGCRQQHQLLAAEPALEAPWGTH
ncbi:hypothetical protein CHLRE_08g362300v5 [Chlamydomonas reinhardtii]|uniref:Uncharacterized protein n=1 Tax=Chlamydomonas reinhardtii TaxID=3055 RepID=A0A2K3DGK6_CHLRE|nr:uncharacterized protein CHLRE_08g362300v5 [Chlamydomonas reinhardtii]PNW79671.1 hypothetical protein CHLRE_08g362300v5 [Chlamydomonas reinhardtii]